MKPKIAIFTVLIVAIMGYVLGLIGDPFTFIVFFLISSLILSFTILWLAIYLILGFIPSNIREVYEARIMRSRTIILACFIFFIFCGWTINHFFLPNIFHPISLLGDVGILLYTIFLGWSLIKPNKKRTLFTGTFLFILFASALITFNSISYKHIELSSKEALKSLPYLTWVPAEKSIQKLSVIKYDQTRSFEGINIYAPNNLSTAYLMDMSGDILHTWSAKINKDDTWHHIEICENGDLLTFVKDRIFIRLDWDSNIKWIKKIRGHHDIAIDENKDIWILARKDETVLKSVFPVPILNDYIVVLSPDGKIKKEISLYKMLRKEIPFDRFINIYYKILQPKTLIKIINQKKKMQFLFDNSLPFDILHNNTIEIIKRDVEGLCKKGDLLISVLRLDLVAILNIEKEKIVWKWGPGSLSRQHHPTFLENGNILIFDNGVKRKYSRIVELNPLTNEIEWEYKANPPVQFYSPRRGSSQRLPNGNTLITESDKGHVFEVTKDGEIVWEFYNPVILNDSKERAAIYRMMRIPYPEKYLMLKNLKNSGSTQIRIPILD